MDDLLLLVKVKFCQRIVTKWEIVLYHYYNLPRFSRFFKKHANIGAQNLHVIYDEPI